MARKRKRKKQKKQLKPTAQVPIGQLTADIERMIADHRGRKAAAMARDLCKHQDFSDELAALAVKAHEARLAEMLDAGQLKEALHYQQSLVQTNPTWQTLFSPEIVLRLDLEAGGTALISQYGSDQDVTRRIERHILDELSDPRPLSSHPALPPEHPLKREAGLVLEAFTEVEEEGGERKQFNEMLRRIGRRSPFVHWRLVIQALAAFYDRRDDDLARALARIPDNSAVRPMAGILSDLAAGRSPRTAMGRRVERKTAGPDMHGKLAEIDELIAQKKWSAFRKAVTTLLNRHFFTRAPGLQTELGALCLFHYIEGGGPMRDDWPPPRTPHREVFALRALSWAGVDDPEQWEMHLQLRGQQLSPLTKALIFDRIATSLMESADVPPSYIPFRSEQKSYLRAVYQDAAEYWDQSVALTPLPEVYYRWSRAALRIDRTTTERILEAWHLAFPEDEEPLLDLVSSCRRRGVYQKALRFFKRLDRLAAGKPAVESMRHYLMLDSAAKHVIQGNHVKAEKELAAIPGSAPPAALTLKMLLRWRMDPGSEQRIAELNGVNRPLQALLLNQLIDQRFRKKGDRSPSLPAEVLEKLDQPNLVVSDYQQFSMDTDPSWNIRPGEHQIPRVLLTAFETTTVSSGILRQCLEFIAGRLFGEFIPPGCRMMLWPLTANGIRRKDADLPIFLAFRALLLDHQCTSLSRLVTWYGKGGDPERRALNCIRAAHQLVANNGNNADIQLVRNIDDAIIMDDIRPAGKRLTQKQLERIVELESTVASETALTKPPRRKNVTPERPKAPSVPSLLEDDEQMEMF